MNANHIIAMNLQQFTNNIELFKTYIPLLDKVYKQASLTAKLDGNPDLVQQGANANELIIPKIAMDGLADYSRNSGYVDGDVTMTNETVKCNFDRGRMFTVDALDNIETAKLAFGQLSSEFIRTKVVPELDAFRFAKYCQVGGISTSTGALSTGANVVSALRAATQKMDDDEVPYEDRHLFITATLNGLVEDMDTTKSRKVMERFASVTIVPQSRFYTAITQNNGTSEGQTSGGYKKEAAAYTASTDTTVDSAKTYYTKSGEKYTAVASPTGNPSTSSYYEKTAGGVDINFMVVHKAAVIQFDKRVVNKVITPEENQKSDGWKFGYRDVSIADAYENKSAGIYVHKAE